MRDIWMHSKHYTSVNPQSVEFRVRAEFRIRQWSLGINATEKAREVQIQAQYPMTVPRRRRIPEACVDGMFMAQG